VHVRERAQLLENGLSDFVPTVADVDDHGTPAGVKVPPAVGGLDPYPIGFPSQGQLLVQYPVKYGTWNGLHHQLRSVGFWVGSILRALKLKLPDFISIGYNHQFGGISIPVDKLRTLPVREILID
jgi:hypothetical protein